MFDKENNKDEETRKFLRGKTKELFSKISDKTDKAASDLEKVTLTALDLIPGPLLFLLLFFGQFLEFCMKLRIFNEIRDKLNKKKEAK